MSISFDVVVLDPPYCHSPGEMLVDACYQNPATTAGLYHDDIVELYRRGMVEARRILKPGGLLWLKCADEIEAHRQRMAHIEIHDIAVGELGMTVEDLFVLVRAAPPPVQHRQRHSRKNVSYMWVLRREE